MHDKLIDVRINFNEEALLGLNLALAFIMFGVALSLNKKDFIGLSKAPNAALWGLISQYLLLPILTVVLIVVLKPHPYLQLGMVLIAVCPGGNVSNFFTYLSKGNGALSVSLSMVSTITAFLLTPIALQVWTYFLPDTNEILRAVSVSFWDLFKIISIILLVPLVLGMGFSKLWPATAQKIQKPIKIISFLILVGIIIGGLTANIEIFKEYYHRVVYLVFIHNGLALLMAFIVGVVTGIGRASTKTITIETGIQNTGLGLALVFNFFDGNGAMAIIAAWGGIWHMVSGFVVSQLFKKYYA